MKKKLVVYSLILLCFNCVIHARVIYTSEAINFARKWIQIENDFRALSGKTETLQFGSVQDLIYDGIKVGYVVEMHPRGYMIIPAISDLAPLKFITYSGIYDPDSIPPFLETLIYRLYFTSVALDYIQPSRQAEEILSELQNTLILADQIPKNESMWNEFLENEYGLLKSKTVWIATIAPLLTSLWGQHYPHNLYTPVKDGLHCPVGCVATAISQIMYYWKHPNFGEQFNRYYWDKGGQFLSARFDHEYQWDKMLDRYRDPLNPPTAEQIDIIGRLSSDVGISLDMNYDIGGSTSNGSRNMALVSFFKYSQDIERADREFFKDIDEWFQLFKGQLDKKWPVYLSVQDKNGGSGHAVVVDGYRQNAEINQVHINLGWGFGGYYTLDDIVGIYGTERDSAVINIHPGHCMDKGSVSGYVKDLYGKGLKNAKIALYNLDMPTRAGGLPFDKIASIDDEGYYVLNCLQVKKYDIRLIGDYTLSGVDYWSYHIDVIANQNKVINFSPLELSLKIERKEERGVYIRMNYTVIDCLAKGYLLSLKEREDLECPLSRYYLMRKELGGEYITLKDFDWKVFENTVIDKGLNKDQSYIYKLIAKDKEGKIVASSEEVII